MKHKDIFYRTKKNIIIISTTIVFLCLFIFAIITQVLYASRLLNNIDKQLVEQAKVFEKPIGSIREVGPLFEVGHLKPPIIPPNMIVIMYENEIIRYISPNAYFNESNIPNFPNSANNKIVNLKSGEYNFRGISFIKNDYKIEVIINIDSELKSINQLNNSIIVSLVMLIIIALCLSIFLASRIIKPVREAYEKQVFFVQDASHEMRTPLAVIKGKLELLASSFGDTIDTHFEHISKMMSEVRGLEKLNSDLLLLSKEDIDFSVNNTSFNLNDFIKDISEFYFDLAEIQNKKFEVNKPKEDITVVWDYNKVKRGIIILIENAFKYTGENGEILLSFENINKFIKITVKDNGIGIKEEDKKRIFDRFFRSAEVRGKNISGTGIGLSLLKSISKKIGIKIKVNSQLNKGSEFILIISKNCLVNN